MIRNAYDIKTKASYTLKLIDFAAVGEDGENNLLPISKPSGYENLSWHNGAIIKEGGIDYLRCIYENGTYPRLDGCYVRDAIYYKGGDGIEDNLVMFTNGGIFTINIARSYTYKPEWKKLFPIGLNSADIFRVGGKDVLVAGGMSFLIAYDGTTVVTKAENQKPPCQIEDVVNHFGRMFVTDYDDGYKIHFSDESDPFNFTISAYEGGYLNVDIDNGKIIKMVSMGEYLYIFAERGIHKLRAYGDQSEFLLKRVEVFTGDIIEESIVKCGNSIVFLSSIGFMQFDGYNCKKLHESLIPIVLDKARETASHLSACYCEHKYYLAYREGDENKAVVIDLDKENFSLIDLEKYRGVVRVNRGGEHVLLYPKVSLPTDTWTPIGYLTNSVFGKRGRLEATAIDLNQPNLLKNVKSIEVSEPIDGWLSVYGEDRCKRVNLKKIGTIPINISGYKLKIALELRSGKARSPMVKVDLLHRQKG